jgi:CRP-like cAMP-binding protein
MARKEIALVSKLRDDAAAAIERGKLARAIELYAELEEAEPTSPTWPKRIGETHRRNGNHPAAIVAFERAAEKYAMEGFLVQAIAVCKLILQIDPAHSSASARLSQLMPAPPPRVEPARTTTADRVVRIPPKPAPPPRTPPIAPIATKPARAARPEPPPPPPNPPSEPMRVEEAPRIEIPPGSGLDAIDFSTLIPGAQPQLRDDGTLSGVNVLPLGPSDLDLELSLDDAEVGTDPVTDRLPGPAARRALLTTPLFPHVPPHVLERLIARMSLLELQAGEVLFREGETGHELFVISEGEVAVESAAVGELARLGPSAFFGEIALVTDLPRSATIRAITRVELLAMNREVLREAVAQHPDVVTVLLRFVRDRLIDRITRTSELFSPFTTDERKALSSRFELVEVVPDALLITQGERADGLYLVVAGKVEVRRDNESVLAMLGSGDVFGELSLLQGGGSTANVRSVSRVLALRMPASTFQEVIMTHPQVLAYLGELAERRTPRAQAEEFVDLHLDMLV